MGCNLIVFRKKRKKVCYDIIDDIIMYIIDHIMILLAGPVQSSQEFRLVLNITHFIFRNIFVLCQIKLN